MPTTWRQPAIIVVLGLLFFLPLLLHPDQVLYSDHSDLLTETLPAKRFLVRSWQQTGELPLWNPYSYGGMPFIHDVKVAAFYPLHLPLYLLPEGWLGPALSWLVLLHVIAAGLCMFAYARSQGLGPTGALVAGLGYMFAGKWLLHLLAGGQYVLAPLAWLPLVLLGLEGAHRALKTGRPGRNSLLRATWAGAAFALIVLGGHPQMTVYAGLFVALWTLGPALEKAGYLGDTGATLRVPAPRRAPRSWQRTCLSLAAWLGFGTWAALVAAALAAVELLPAVEAMTQATRGEGVSSGSSLALSVLVALELIGAPVTGPSWELPGGLGVLWVVGAVLGALLGPRRARFQAGVAVLLLLFGLGGGAALQFLPGLGLFQIHFRMLLLLAVPVALLTGHATQALLDGAVGPRRARAVLLAVVCVAAACFAMRYFLAERQALLPPVYWLAMLAAAPVAFWLLGRVGPASRAGPDAPTTARHDGGAAIARGFCFSRQAAPTVWLLLLLADLWALGWPLVAVRSQETVYAPSACVRYLAGSRAEHGRVLDRGLTEPSASPLDPALPLLLEIESLRGYNSVDVRRYKEYLQFIMDDDQPVRPRHGPFGFPILANFRIENKSLLDLLGTRYLLQPTRPSRKWLQGLQGRGEVSEDPAWRKVYEDPDPRAYLIILGGVQDLPPFTVYANQTVLPRAFVVPRAKPLHEGGEVLAALKAADFRREVLLEGADAEEASTPVEEGFRPAVLREYQPNRVVVEVDGGAPGYLVLADVWFPGWTCTVDGRGVPVRRGDYLFRAVALPAGAREVVFRFEPWSYRWGGWISGTALALVALGSALALFARRLRGVKP
jgi:hypothetical protein